MRRFGRGRNARNTGTGGNDRCNCSPGWNRAMRPIYIMTTSRPELQRSPTSSTAPLFVSGPSLGLAGTPALTQELGRHSGSKYAPGTPQLVLMTLQVPAGFLEVAASHGGRELGRTLSLGRLLRRNEGADAKSGGKNDRFCQRPNSTCPPRMVPEIFGFTERKAALRQMRYEALQLSDMCDCSRVEIQRRKQPSE